MKAFRLGRLSPCIPACPMHCRPLLHFSPPLQHRQGTHCHNHPFSRPRTSRAAAGGDPPPPPPEDNGEQQQGPQEIALPRRFPSVGYTFILAGFLKILTGAWVATSAPSNLTRTAFGEMSRYLVVPFGIALCFLAKRIVDSGLHESKKFMWGLMAVLVFIYFGAYRLLFRVDPATYTGNLYRPTEYPTAARDSRRGDYYSSRQSPSEGNLNIMPGAERVYRAVHASRTPEMQERRLDRELDRMIPEGVIGQQQQQQREYQQEYQPQYPRGMASSALFEDGVGRASSRSGGPKVASSSARAAARAAAIAAAAGAENEGR